MGEAAAGAMPSERKSSRRRTRTKNRGLRQPRCKVSRCDAGCSARNPAVGSHREGSAVGCQDGAAGLRAEMRQCLQKIWEYRQLWLIVSSFCAVLLLCFYLGLGSSNSRSSNEQSLENSSAWEIVLNFFYPTTCIPKENQVVKPCNEQQNYKKTECLVNRCCFSSSKISNVNCFVPLQDSKFILLHL
uniref:Uncharacterized protein n=1 Tax=Suricata suricatta TaxID=37032 RepID=A0A673V9I8_SURSU